MSPRFVLTKLLRALLTLALAVTFVFVVLRMSGDPVTQMLPDDAPASVREQYREMWGLDRPLPEQYLRYVAGLARGDFGFSFRDDRPALDVVLERVPLTLELGLSALALTLGLGLGAGILAALRRGSTVDHATMAFTILGHSMPNFFLGILLILWLAMTWRILPSSGVGTWQHLVMPTVTLGTSYAATVARFTRSSLLEVLHQPYMRTAKAKGVPFGRTILRHALPNAGIPIATVVGLRIGALIGGAVVVETVFAWPGVGQLLVSSVAYRDLAVVQTVVLLIAFTMVVVNFLVDITYGWLDPRIGAGRREARA
ncbi:ABC transporter permease [Mangrovibrevibacter kandeliae]|uniref:ABC transporter permease n=1 Tax=Mangrovibrevibacter kandeliae TaxID=2968473 RepID=UPI002119B46E|nr:MULTISPECIES: ABC transporter permease [unclassified Aurantimonas]MCQ8781861.1 ABC transporter permease [Aurantimonas sp. CSK15Z-1]MCW4115481.1 ABC transporter permease [Aurantimonas sp. MSK8Z-1]